MGYLVDLAERAVAPLIIRAEARREARRIRRLLRFTLTRIEQRRGRQMAHLVLLYLQEMESNNSAAHTLGD